MDVDKKKILNEIKEYKKFKSNADFARFLGITPQGLATWYARNTFKVNKIANAIPELNYSWLLTGEGPMLKEEKNRFSQMTEQEIEEITKSAITDELVKAYQRGEIYPASIHDKIVAEKNAEIKEKETQIGELQRRVWELEQKVGKKE